MAKITRETFKRFAASAGGSDVGVFGSLAASAPTYSQVIATIQSLAAWDIGWAAETVATNVPALEDLNGVQFVFAYMIAYMLQQGIPEWDAGTTYYINSVVSSGGIAYTSITDNNLNNAPPNATYWKIGILGGSEQTGVVKMYASTSAPSGYLLCDGSAVSRTTYSDLFATIGTTYGAGNGSTTFNIPDMRGKIPAGYKAADSDFGVLGGIGGNTTHSHIGGSLVVPAITHITNRGGSVPYGTGSSFPVDDNSGGSDWSEWNLANVPVTGTTAIASSLQPYLTLNYIIKT